MPNLTLNNHFVELLDHLCNDKNCAFVKINVFWGFWTHNTTHKRCIQHSFVFCLRQRNLYKTTFRWPTSGTVKNINLHVYHILIVLLHMFGDVEQKLLDRSQKALVFFQINFFVIQILDNIGSLLFISWAISMKLSGYYFFMPIYGCAKFRWKISKNKIQHFW
jgi:hypothetical protein